MGGGNSFSDDAQALARIQYAATNASFNNAQTTPSPASGGVPAGTTFQPGQYAQAFSNSNLQYWMPGTTIFMPGTLLPMTDVRLDGMVLHELLHNLGDTGIRTCKRASLVLAALVR
jgi:hypothetical protein